MNFDDFALQPIHAVLWSMIRMVENVENMLQQLNKKVDSMSDLKSDIANIKGDVSQLVTLVPQVLQLLQQYHDAAGSAVESGDLADLAQVHSDMAPQIAAMQAALPTSTT